jgi:hypothetical protein
MSMKCEKKIKNCKGTFFQIYPSLLKNHQIFTPKKYNKKLTTMLNLSWDANVWMKQHQKTEII